MIILMTFLEKIENFEYITITLIKKILTNPVFFSLLKIALQAAKMQHSTIFYRPNSSIYSEV